MISLSIKFYINICILWLTVCFSYSLHAQTPDSIVATPNSIPLTDSMFKIIDDMHERSAKMESINKKGFDLAIIQKSLPAVSEVIHSIDLTLKYGAQYLDMKSLNTFRQLIDQSKIQLDGWRKQLLAYSQQIVSAQTNIQNMRDFPLQNTASASHFFVDLYKTELANLDSTFQQLKLSNEKYNQDIQQLQIIVSRNFYKASDLQRDLSEQITNYSIRTLGKESTYIWERSTTKTDETEAVNFGKITLAIDQQIILSYFLMNFEKHFLIAFLVFVVFIIWVRRNYLAIATLNNRNNILKSLEDPHTISSLPILSAFMVVFSLCPLLDLQAPEAYVALMQVILFIITSIFIFKYGSKNERSVWLGIFLVYVLSAFISTGYNPNTLNRILFLLINLYLIFSSRFFLKHNGGDVRIKGIIRFLLYAIIVINVAAFLLNCAGRVTFSKALTNAVLMGFIQVIALSIFKDIMVTAIQLKNVVGSLKEKQRSFLDMQTMSNQLFKLLSFLSLFLCFVVFAVNMNFFSSVQKLVTGFLFNTRTIGSTTFTIGNIVLFFVVIYLSSLAQRYVGYFFGEGSRDSIPEGKKGSRLVIWKLVIIIAGFALAIMVSGLPLDKVTIVLSAFGVGIGLGLQNVVNNFVSGLILIFERPLQVGDYVEVSGLKGWVKDIGIRATHMENNDGAEIIVPNGSILAGNLINWTLSSSKVRVEMQLKISPLSALTLAKEIITEEILNYKHVVDIKTPEILQTGLTNTSADLKVSFWIDHINKQEIAKSTVLNALYARFNQNGITIV